MAQDPQGKIRRRLGSDREAASETLGQMLSVLLMAGFVTTAGVAMVQVQPPGDGPIARIQVLLHCGTDGWLSGDERIQIRHAGGPSLAMDVTVFSVQVREQTYAYSEELLQLDPPESGIDPLNLLQAPEGSGSEDPTLNPFLDKKLTTGETWRKTLTAGPETAIKVVVTSQTSQGRPAVIFEGPATAVQCPDPTGSGGFLGLGGLFSGAFEDIGCDGVFHNGADIPIPDAEILDGHYDTLDANCLVILDIFHPLSAPSVQLISRGGGIILDVNVHATGGDVILDAGGGLVDVIGQSLRAKEDVIVRAGTQARLASALLVSQDGRIQIDVGGGELLAPHMSIVAGESSDPSQGGSGGPLPPVDPYNPAGPGSVRVCKIIHDPDRRVTSGWERAGETFILPGTLPPATSPPPAGQLPDTVFTTPLRLNADLIFGDGKADAQCKVYDGLALGGYYVNREILTNAAAWQEPLWNDQHQTAVSALNDFYPFSGELFDNDPSNDNNRETNSDGHLVLSSSRPHRTIIVLNEFTQFLAEPTVAQVIIESTGGHLALADASVRAFNGDIKIRSLGGDILAPRALLRTDGSEARVSMQSGGGLITITAATVQAMDGGIEIRSGSAGGMLATTATILSARDTILAAGNPMDLTGANVRSIASDLFIDLHGTTNTVTVALAEFRDRDNRAALSPLGAIVIGIPAYGTIG